jgi:4-aminobutyrate aminotransferase-like enzyme
MPLDLKSLVTSRLGENYDLHARHLNSTLVSVQRIIGFDQVYARAEGAYLYDLDDRPYLDFLSGYSVYNIGRNHPAVRRAIADVLEMDLPNMVQMDCSLLSGLLAEALTKKTAPHLDAGFLLQLRRRGGGRGDQICPRRDGPGWSAFPERLLPRADERRPLRNGR